MTAESRIQWLPDHVPVAVERNQAQVRENARIGSGCVVGKNVYVDIDVVVGDNVKIQNNVSLYHGVTVETKQGRQLTGLLVEDGKLSLGRSFGLMPANRGVVSTGMYRLVRHPIYLGYLVTLAKDAADMRATLDFLLHEWLRVESLTAQVEAQDEEFVTGTSTAMKAVVSLVQKVAPLDTAAPALFCVYTPVPLLSLSAFAV